MLIGWVSEEGNSMRSRPTEAEWLATLTKSYREAKTTALVAALKKAHPEKSIRTLSYICNGSGLNSPNLSNSFIGMATIKYKEKGAPVLT
jgi:para-nitrobenzyl esterase